LYGDNRKYTVLLVVPEWSELRAWAIRSKIPGVTEATTPEGLMTESAVISLLASEIEGASLSIKSYERPARFDIIIEPFSPENQMLTPKLSIRRNNVFSTFKVLIDSLYTAEGGYKLKVSSASKADNEM
jgi:long-chain acyl-CoA synthetase